MRTTPAGPARSPTIWAGRAIAFIGAGHIAIAAVQTWSSWGDRPTARPGRPGQLGRTADPGRLLLAAWVLLGGRILEPSGFPLGLIPVALLFLAHRANQPKRWTGR
ncbi:hypothetical protein ACFXJJ_34345, partial [Streptomyces sp. NPDC059233]